MIQYLKKNNQSIPSGNQTWLENPPCSLMLFTSKKCQFSSRISHLFPSCLMMRKMVTNINIPRDVTWWNIYQHLSTIWLCLKLDQPMTPFYLCWIIKFSLLKGYEFGFCIPCVHGPKKKIGRSIESHGASPTVRSHLFRWDFPHINHPSMDGRFAPLQARHVQWRSTQVVKGDGLIRQLLVDGFRWILVPVLEISMGSFDII